MDVTFQVAKLSLNSKVLCNEENACVVNILNTGGGSGDGDGMLDLAVAPVAGQPSSNDVDQKNIYGGVGGFAGMGGYIGGLFPHLGGVGVIGKYGGIGGGIGFGHGGFGGGVGGVGGVGGGVVPFP